jgi:hypothetical protein
LRWRGRESGVGAFHGVHILVRSRRRGRGIRVVRVGGEPRACDNEIPEFVQSDTLAGIAFKDALENGVELQGDGQN